MADCFRSCAACGAWLTVPGFGEIIRSFASNIQYTILFGVLWGIGGLTYGLGVRYLGMSSNSMVLGFCSAGALVPSIYYNFSQAGQNLVTIYSHHLGPYCIGCALCLLGIYVSGKAGMMKEKELSPEMKKKSVEEFSLVKGLIVAIISGILSACFNFGIEAGKPMAEAAVKAGINPLFQNNVIYVVLLWGGLSTNIWCMILNGIKFRYPTNKDPGIFLSPCRNYLVLQFFYGMGESKLGNGASSWILHMAFIILVANGWGLYLKEWKGVSDRTKRTITIGIGLIILSVIVVGIGNSMK